MMKSMAGSWSWALTNQALVAACQGYEALHRSGKVNEETGVIEGVTSLNKFFLSQSSVSTRHIASQAVRLLTGSGLVIAKQGGAATSRVVTIADVTRKTVTPVEISHLYSEASKSADDGQHPDEDSSDVVHDAERVAEAVADVIVSDVSEQVLPSSDEQGSQVSTFDLLDPPPLTTLPLPSDGEQAPVDESVPPVTAPLSSVDELIAHTRRWRELALGRGQALAEANEEKDRLIREAKELNEETGRLEQAVSDLEDENLDLRRKNGVLEQECTERREADKKLTLRLQGALEDLGTE